MPSRKSVAAGRSDTVPIAAVMRGLITWTLKDLQKSLLIAALQAHDVIKIITRWYPEARVSEEHYERELVQNTGSTAAGVCALLRFNGNAW